MTPWEYEIWDANECAKYLRVTLCAFDNRIKKIKGFPRPFGSNRNPHWRAMEVAQWILSCKSIEPRQKYTARSGVLYRHFDGNGNLLYVGVSVSALLRTKAHSLVSAWFGDVRSITVEHFPTMRDALRAEKMAIRRERPKFNKKHSVNSRGKHGQARDRDLGSQEGGRGSANLTAQV